LAEVGRNAAFLAVFGHWPVSWRRGAFLQLEIFFENHAIDDAICEFSRNPARPRDGEMTGFPRGARLP
jgi:hypothetical protein